MIEFIKQQLRDGKKVPWRYREYGAIAVKEMFDAVHDPIAVMRRTAVASDLLPPTNRDLEHYCYLTSRLGGHDFTMAHEVMDGKLKLGQNDIQQHNGPATQAKELNGSMDAAV